MTDDLPLDRASPSGIAGLDYEDTLREFRIDERGLRVGAPLEQFHGVLTRTPTFQGNADQMLESR